MYLNKSSENLMKRIFEEMSYLIEKNELLTPQTNFPDWLIKQYDYWNETVGNKEFPCHFGTQSENNGSLRYSYIENDNYTLLPEVLREFLALSKNNPRRRHALVLFIEPEENKDLKYYNEKFWSILNYLHENDNEEWPDSWTNDPDDVNWEFIFDREPIFVSANMPAYQNRKTRNLGECQILIFQPRRIFNGISEDTKSGGKAISMIRDKVENIEGMPTHPDLGGYGNTHEWKQYVISDDNKSETGKCPFMYKYSKQ
ncbi:YqcI/YcgG family protein [Staphylococcus xylosus]